MSIVYEMIDILKCRDLDGSNPTIQYHLTSQLTYHPSHVTTLALIKRGLTLDQSTPLASQLHFLNLFGGDETPYDSVRAVVSGGVKPWFDAVVGDRGSGKDGDPKMGESLTRNNCSSHKFMSFRYTWNEEKVRRT